MIFARRSNEGFKMDMENKIKSAIKKWNMIDAGDTVVAALSGGADSCALLNFLHSVKDEYKINILAAHLNHGLRGGESDADELFCVRMCSAYGVPCAVLRADARAEAKKRRMSLEEAGRALRYEFFEKTANNIGADKIAVAHNKNDNAETILLNLIRGAGPGGIAGIPPVRGNIVRPLIDCPRDEIEAYCAQNNIKYRTDSSNASVLYTRNKIRNALIPRILEINPSGVDAIVNCGALILENERYMDGLATNAFGVCSGPGGWIDIKKLSMYNEAIVKRVLRAAYGQTGGSMKNLTHLHVEALIKLMSGPSGKTIDLPGGAEARKDYSRLIFTLKKKNSEKTKDFCYNLIYNEPVYVNELGIIAYLTHEAPPTDMSERFNVSGGVTFRSRRPGDRIYFKSINGHKKIKDFFNEKKIPAHTRSQIGMFAQGNEIIWIPSIRVKSDKFLNGGETVYAGIRRGDDHRRGD